MPTKQLVEEELARIEKRIKWAERKSRWEAILWFVAIIASVVFLGLGLSALISVDDDATYKIDRSNPHWSVVRIHSGNEIIESLPPEEC